jgi:ribosomal protein S21
MDIIETKALENAIKHFEHKIENQGLITNARDEEHLQRLKELKKELNNK